MLCFHPLIRKIPSNMSIDATQKVVSQAVVNRITDSILLPIHGRVTYSVLYEICGRLHEGTHAML